MDNKKDVKTKEIIYLDTEIVNSLLAQLDEGLISNMTTSLSTGNESGTEEQEGTSHMGGGNLNVVVAGGSYDYAKENVSKAKTVFSEKNSELIEIAMDDYSLDLLVNHFDDLDMLKHDSTDMDDGEFVLSLDDFEAYDFNRLAQITADETIQLLNGDARRIESIEESIKKLRAQRKNKNSNNKLITNQIDELKKEREEILRSQEGIDNFKNVFRFGSVGDVLFPGSSLFRVGNLIAVCPKENLRIDESTLSILNLTKRKIKILGIVISKREEIQPKIDAEGNTEQLASNEIAAKTPAIFIDIILDSFSLSTYEDYFVRPIAIYFD